MSWWVGIINSELFAGYSSEMERMPHEILREIFNFLDPIDLFSVAMVCKAWNKISREDKIWMKWKSELKSQYFQWLKEQAAKYASGKTLDWIHSQSEGKGLSVSPTVGMDYDYFLKLLLIGDAGVGKKSILLRFADDPESDEFVSTIGVFFKMRIIKLYGKTVKKIKLQIWHPAGQERFRTITSSYYRGAHGIMLVYDVSNRESFVNLKYWFDQAESYTPRVVKTVIGHVQSSTSDRVVSVDEAKEFAAEHGCHYWEVSARYCQNVEEAFVDLVKEILPDLSPSPRPPSEQLFLERVKAILTIAPADSNKAKCIVS